MQNKVCNDRSYLHFCINDILFAIICKIDFSFVILAISMEVGSFDGSDDSGSEQIEILSP